MGSGREPLNALNAAVAEAWRVFDAPPPATLGVCRGCCMNPEIEADFLNRPAREMPAEYLADWFFAATADGFGREHVAWLVPRIFEIAAAGEDVAASGNEAAFGRLRLAGFPDGWRPEERAAVQGFLETLFDAFLADPDRWTWSLDDLLCMAGQAGADVLPLLARLDDLPDADLVDLLSRDPGRLRGAIPVSAFWDDTPQRAQVWEWMTSAALADRLIRFASGGRSAPARADAALAIAEGMLAASDPPQG